MASEPLLSLVMPVYNVAAYLPRCLESLAQLAPAADEIIVVDDGSSDDCPAILAAWAERLPQMRVIRQENGGLSAARNAGLEQARGRWLAFVDSDDFVAPDAYARLIAMAEADDLDMALMNATYHFEGRQPDYPIYQDVAASAVMPGAEWLKERLAAGRLLHMVWMHLYRREFIETHALRFVPRLIHEDVPWTTRALLAARRVRYDPQPGYFYRIPERRFSAEQNVARFDNLTRSSVFNCREMARLAREDVADAELRRLLLDFSLDSAFAAFHKAERLPRPRRGEVFRALRREGLFTLLWQIAHTGRQRRRVARNWLRSLLVAR